MTAGPAGTGLLSGGNDSAYDNDGDVGDMGADAQNGTLTAARGHRTGDPDDLVLDDINNWDPQK